MQINELFDFPERRQIREINIVPILDMLTTIIFFLLLSTSFIAFNKVSVPPARTSTISDAKAPIPLQPRLLLAADGNAIKLVFEWSGNKPGSVVERYPAEIKSDELSAKISSIVHKFHGDFASEKTLQLGLSGDLPFSKLILAMDAVHNDVPDLVLLSHEDAQLEAKKFAEKGSQ